MVQERDQLLDRQEEDLRQDVFAFIECHEPSKYRKKIKGFHMAFNIKDKYYRIPEEQRAKMNSKPRKTADDKMSQD